MISNGVRGARLMNGLQQTIEVVHEVRLKLIKGDLRTHGFAAGGVERDEYRSDVEHGGDELPCTLKAGTRDNGHGATREALKRQCAVSEAGTQVEATPEAQVAFELLVDKAKQAGFAPALSAAVADLESRIAGRQAAPGAGMDLTPEDGLSQSLQKPIGTFVPS